MSREQLTEQTQSDAAASEVVRDGDIQGLPPYLFGQVMKVKPGDAAGLVALLRLYPPYSERILAAASPRVGLSTIKQAQAMMPQETVGAAGSLGSTAPGSEYLDESPTVAPRQVKRIETPAEHDEELRDLEGESPSTSTSTAPVGQDQPKEDEASLASARAFNAAHPEWVARFIEIIKDPSFVGPDRKIIAEKVVAFQRTQGIDADGKVGPQTIAAAQKYMDAHPNNFGME